MNYFIIGDEDAVLGFGMVGVRGSVVNTKEETEMAFNAVLKDKEIGIIIITTRTAELIRPLIEHYIFTLQFPLIVEIQDRIGPVKEKQNVREMVNRAIGIKL